MRSITPSRGLVVACLALAALAPAATAGGGGASELRVFVADDGTEIPYTLLTPRADERTPPWPGVLALPPGAQDAAMVEWGLERYWAAGPAAGWVIVSPEAPPGGWEAPRGKRYALDLTREVAHDLRIEANRFHLAGVSNGGAAAFHLATDLPGRFLSVTVLPGMPRGTASLRRLDRLGPVPVTMYVGAEDRGWLDGARRTAERLRRTTTPVELVVLPGEGHVLESLSGPALFERLDRLRPGATRDAAPSAQEPR